jgi:hypothetical protein
VGVLPSEAHHHGRHGHTGQILSGTGVRRPAQFPRSRHLVLKTCPCYRPWLGAAFTFPLKTV